MTAFALRADGWYLRQDIIWAKPNPMPESVTDRCTKSHEYIFLMAKSQKYYYDNEAIKEPCITNDDNVRDRDTTRLNNVPGRTKMAGLKTNNYEMRNKRDVWMVNTKPNKEAHFAMFPDTLIMPCVLAGCPKDGVVLDCFMGAGTTAVVAKRNNRNYIGIELNPEHIKIAKRRIAGTLAQENMFDYYEV
jgi:DNA modification methylase